MSLTNTGRAFPQKPLDAQAARLQALGVQTLCPQPTLSLTPQPDFGIFPDLPVLYVKQFTIDAEKWHLEL